MERSPPDGVARRQPMHLPRRRPRCAHTAGFHTPREDALADATSGGTSAVRAGVCRGTCRRRPRGAALALGPSVRTSKGVAQRRVAMGAARRGRFGAPLKGRLPGAVGCRCQPTHFSHKAQLETTPRLSHFTTSPLPILHGWGSSLSTDPQPSPPAHPLSPTDPPTTSAQAQQHSAFSSRQDGVCHPHRGATPCHDAAAGVARRALCRLCH